MRFRKTSSSAMSVVVASAMAFQSAMGAVPFRAPVALAAEATPRVAYESTYGPLDRDLSPIAGRDRSEVESVSFSPNGGSGTTFSRSVSEGLITMPACPFSNGTRRFLGWSSSEAGERDLFSVGQEVSVSSLSAGTSLTLYATWSDGDGESLRAGLGLDEGAVASSVGVSRILHSTDTAAIDAISAAGSEAATQPTSALTSIDDILAEDEQGGAREVGEVSLSDVRDVPTPSISGKTASATSDSATNTSSGSGSTPDASSVTSPAATTTAAAAPTRPSAKAKLPSTGGDYYVSAATIQRTYDGTAPFDANNAAGNDANDNNNVVRSFDTILYNVAYVTALTNPTVPVSEGKVRAFMGMSKSPREASFDIDALSWMRDIVLTYTYEDGYVEQYSDIDSGADKVGTLAERDWHYVGEHGVEWDHGEVVRQTVEGYRYLSSFSNAIPGTGTLSFAIQVSGARDGDTIRPDVVIWADDTVRQTVGNVPTTRVSAAPNYDLQIRYEDQSTGQSWMWIDREGGAMYPVRQEGIAEEKARVFGYSVTFAMKNADASKGMKGVALPYDQIMFDVRMTSSYLRPNSADPTAYEDRTLTDGWTPYLWDVHEAGRAYQNSSCYGNGIWTGWGEGEAIASRRQMRDFSGTGASQPTRTAPYNEHTSDPASEEKKRYEASCYNGGNIYASATDDPNVFRILMDGFEIDYKSLQFPSRVMATWYSSYLDHAGTIASGYFMVAAPIPADVTGGSHHLDVFVENLWAKTDPEADWLGRVSEPQTDNNSSGHNNVIYGPGTYAQYVYYLDNPNWNQGDYQSYSFRKNRLRINSTTTAETAFKACDLLLKFDDEFVELLPEDANNRQAVGITDPSVTPTDFRRFYAAKVDGTGWASDAEMLDATMESLRFFDTLDDLEATGATCVGVLLEARSEDSQIFKSPSGTLCLLDVVAKTRADVENSSVFQLTGDSRAWSETAEMPPSVTRNDHVIDVDGQQIHYYGTCDPTWTHERYVTVTADNTLSESYVYPSDYPRPTYAQGYARYQKTTYEDGRITGGHSYPGIHYGDSALVIGDKANVTVHTVVNDGTDKTYYDLDNGERTAMMKVSAGSDFVSANQALASDGMIDTLTVTVTLPSTLTYQEGSANYDPVSVVTGADGSTVLTFKLHDVVIGSDPTDITFLTKIGHIGQPDDVDNNESITIETTVVPDKNPSAPSVEDSTIDNTTIRVIKLASAAIAKDTVSDVGDLGGENGWILHFGNSSEIAVANGSMLDVLPYDGDPNGSEFHGGYRVTGLSVDLTDAPTIAAGAVSAYVTTSEAVRGHDASTVSVLGEGIWVAAARSASGRKLTFALPSSVDASRITAVRFLFSSVPGKEYVHARIDYSATSASGGLIERGGSVQQGLDSFGNTFSQYGSNQASVVHSNLVTEKIIERVVRGKVWIDADHDGLQGEGEEFLAGVPVALVGADGTPLTSLVTGEPLRAVTDEDGRYEFSGVPAGRGHVRFYNEAHALDLYATTMRYATVDGEPQTEIDSNVTGTNGDDGKLEHMDSGSIWLPQARQIAGASYEVSDVDAGLTLKKATWQPAALKTMLNRDLMNPFPFEVIDADTGEVVSVGESDPVTGGVRFEPIEYDSTQAGEHSYIIREIDDAQPGVTYDLSDHPVTVLVEDTGEANMSVWDVTSDGVAWDTPGYELEAMGEDTEVVPMASGDGSTLYVYAPKTDGLAIADASLVAGKSYTVTLKMRKHGGHLEGIGGYSQLSPVSAFVVDGKAYPGSSYSSGVALPDDKDIHTLQVTFRYDGGQSDEPGLFDRFWIQPNKNGSEAVAVDIWDMRVCEDPVIANEYHSKGEWLPQAKKVLTGRALEAGQFTFQLLTLDEDDGRPEEERLHVIEETTNDEFGNVYFETMRFDEHDCPARLTYYVREVNDARPGYTYETNTRTIRLTLTDNWDGTIDVSPSTNGGTNLLRGHDFLEGREEDASWLSAGRKTDHWMADLTHDQDDHTLTIPGSLLTDGRTYRLSYKVARAGDVSAVETPATRVDVGGSEVLRASVGTDPLEPKSSREGDAQEVTSADGIKWQRMLLEPNTCEVVFRATDSDGDGTADDVIVTPVIGGAMSGIFELYDFQLNDTDALSRFTNAYHAYGGWVPEVEKVLEGRELGSGQFRFEMARTDGTPLTDQATQLGSASATYNAGTMELSVSGGNGAADVRLPTPDAKVIYGGSGTWSFEVLVPGSGEATLVLDENNRLSTSTAAGEMDEDLSATMPTERQRVGFADGEQATRDAERPALMRVTVPRGRWVSVRQTYTNDSPANTRQSPLLEAGTTLGVSGETFSLRNLAFSVGSAFATNGTAEGAGDTRFARVAYDETDAARTYIYSIIEQDTGLDGYTYDRHAATVSVSVSDNGDGTLTVTPTYGTGDEVPTFRNSYHATGTATMTAWKALRGRSLAADEFAFSLYEEADDGTVGTDAVATGRNDGDGVVKFSGIEFDQDDVGQTFHYVAREDDLGDPDVRYTTDEFRYAVTVLDDGNGTLSFDVRNVIRKDDGTYEETATMPFFVNDLYAGQVAIEKRTVGGVGDETFTFRLRIRNEDGTPFAPDDFDELLTVEPIERVGTGGTGGSGGGVDAGSEE